MPGSFFVVRWLKDVSISKKLYFTVGLMGLLIAVELGTLMFSIHTLSSVRALVSAEGLWSKAQKDAAYSLRKYGRSGNEQDYRDYQSLLRVPLGDHKTRLELMKPEPDFSVARQGFLEGRVHPDDIDGAMMLMRRFHGISYIAHAIGYWTMGDSLMSQMIEAGTALHNEIASGNPSPEKVTVILSRIDDLNNQLTHLEDDFSSTLGDGSRWLTNLVLRLLLGLVLTVEICGLSLTILISRSMSAGLNNIISAADKIAGGDFNVRAKVFSHDEIGILANAFNEMTSKLEQTIKALTESEDKLKKSRDVAEQSLAVKGYFLANMSHEIRTPMNAVIGFTRLLEDSELDKEQQEIVHAIKISSQSLMTIINDILDYSKIESGKIILERIPFSVAKTLDSLKVLLQQKAEEKRLTLLFRADKNIPELIVGDPTRLMQILLNLSDNAIKFTEHGSIEISVRNVETEDADFARLEFQVKDTGEGIPADKLSEIFERFTQVSAATTRKHGGTGLGMSIVKGLVELQHGNLSLRSELEIGSVFTFTIRYDKAPSTARDQQKQLPLPPETGSMGLVRILVAEDNPINQMLILQVLRKYGFSPELADNGEIAVAKVRANHYDLVLMDIQMPEMDGYEATRIIREELKSNIPIVALTAHAMNQEKEKCLGLGMNDFISKPFDQKQLRDTILRLCPAAAAILSSRFNS